MLSSRIGSCEPQHFFTPADDVRQSGAPDNFSTETPQSLHIEHCKEPYHASNKHDLDEQILNFLTKRRSRFVLPMNRGNSLGSTWVHLWSDQFVI